jgi:hypothetical protein
MKKSKVQQCVCAVTIAFATTPLFSLLGCDGAEPAGATVETTNSASVSDGTVM